MGNCNNEINPIGVHLWQSAHSSLKNLFAEERLDDVGAVKAVHAVHPKCSILCAQRSLSQLCVQPAWKEMEQSLTVYSILVSVFVKVASSQITLVIATLRSYSSLHGSYVDMASSSK